MSRLGKNSGGEKPALTGSREPLHDRRPGKQNTSERGKHVQVGLKPRVETDTITHWKDLEPELRLSIWYSNKELNRTMEEARQTVVAMQDGLPLADDNSEFTSRGLEYMTPDGFDITTSSLEAVKIVLEEQQRQRDEKLPQLNPELLAATIDGISRHRLRIAHLAGLKDARGVYGAGKFKTDPQASTRETRRGRSRSTDGKRELRKNSMPNAAGGVSQDDLAERTRRRRGSRGALGKRRTKSEITAPTLMI